MHRLDQRVRFVVAGEYEVGDGGTGDTVLGDDDQLMGRGIGENDDGVFDAGLRDRASRPRVERNTCRSVLARRNSASPSFASSSPAATWATGAAAPCTGYPSEATRRRRPDRAFLMAASSARNAAFSAMTF